MDVLSIELLTCIIQCLALSGTPVSVSVAHEVTNALTSLRLVSSTVRSLPNTTSTATTSLTALPRTLLAQVRILQNEEHACWDSARRRPIRLCLPDKSWVLRLLYLASFPADTIDGLDIAAGIESFFELRSRSLTRRVTDMPLRSLYLEDGSRSIRPNLRRDLRKLDKLEEFTSAQDELYLDTSVAEGYKFLAGSFLYCHHGLD